MRIDDPQVLRAIEQLEQACDTLRRLAGFPTRIEITNTSTRAAHACHHAGCTYQAYERDDLAAHLEIDHGARP